VREEEEQGDLVIGGGRWVGDRCIIPVVRVLAVHLGEGIMVSLSPVALLFSEGEAEYMALLPGAPSDTREIISALYDDIERERKRSLGFDHHS
jgi:hypothetical protein